MVSSALAVRPDQSYWDQAQLAALKQLGIDRAPQGDLAVFLNYAQRTGLDPFARQIYMIRRRDRDAQDGYRWTIQASIDALRIIAQRSGEYQGQTPVQWCDDKGIWHDVWLADKPPAAARVGVWRAGFREALYGIALWAEFNGGTANWKTMGAHMLAKCAEALALRKAYPHDLSGLYTAEEMDQAGGTIDGQVIAESPIAPAKETPTVEDVLQHVAEARSRDDLALCWQIASRYGLLDKPVPDSDPPINVGVFIVGYMEQLKKAAEEAVGEAEGEAEATPAAAGGDVPVAPPEEELPPVPAYPQTEARKEATGADDQ